MLGCLSSVANVAGLGFARICHMLWHGGSDCVHNAVFTRQQCSSVERGHLLQQPGWS